MHRREIIRLPGSVAAAWPLTLATLLVLLHPSAVAHAQNSQDAAEIVSRGVEIPASDCLGAAVARSWAVIADKTASSGTAIEHSRTASSEGAETLAICRLSALKDSNISLRFKVLHGDHGSGGVAFRMATPDAYYLVKIDVRRDRALLLLVMNGAVEEIADVDADVAFDAWHTLAVRAQDDRFTVYLDGTWIFTGYDKTLTHAGRIALWTEPGSTTLFERITIGPIAAPSHIGTFGTCRPHPAMSASEANPEDICSD